MVAAAINAVAIALLSVIVFVATVTVRRECSGVLELPTNGSHDVYCEIVPTKIDLSRVGDLTRLDLSRNGLNGILVTGDRNTSLPALDLSDNHLRNPCHVQLVAVVVGSLDLSSNLIERFVVCWDVKNLTMSRNRIRSLNRVDVANAHSLESLDLGNNSILWIENDTFAGMSSLQWLNLRGNALARISGKMLPSTTLRYLDVSGNRGLDRWTVFEPFENLVELSVAHNPQLAPVVLAGFGPRLQALDASHANLTEVPLAPAPLLGSLILNGNAIRAVNSGDLDGFPLLRSLEISNNLIVTVEDDAFGRLDLLSLLDLSSNALETVPKSLPGSLRTLNLEDNHIQSLGPEDFEGCRQLRALNVRRNRIQHVQDLAFVSMPFLDVLDLSENPIQMITREMLTGPVRLKELKLERLNAPKTPTFPFTDTGYLTRIQLRGSRHLAAILLNDSAVLSSMLQLEHLDLSGCAVAALPRRLPDYMPKMRTLAADDLECAGTSWLGDWLCEMRTSGGSVTARTRERLTDTELRIRNFRLPEPDSSSADSVRCRAPGDGRANRPVFDERRCAAISTKTTTTTAMPTTSMPTTSMRTTSTPTISMPTTSVPTISMPTTSVPTTTTTMMLIPTTTTNETTVSTTATTNKTIGSMPTIPDGRRDVTATQEAVRVAEQVAVFARLSGPAVTEVDSKNARDPIVRSTHPGVAVFVCVVLLSALLVGGTVLIGVRGAALNRLSGWRQSAADVDYQSIEIKSLESLNHVERW